MVIETKLSFSTIGAFDKAVSHNVKISIRIVEEKVAHFTVPVKFLFL